jgi:hypothetical protein
MHGLGFASYEMSVVSGVCLSQITTVFVGVALCVCGSLSINAGEPFPLLCWTSDQGVFAAYIFLAVSAGLRIAFFPDANHQESNIDASLLPAINLGHLDDKMLFLARLKHGPNREAGHWHSQLREGFEALCRCLFM